MPNWLFRVAVRKTNTYLKSLENDQLFPDEVRISGKKSLEENKVEHEMKVYSDVPHGESNLGPEKCVEENLVTLSNEPKLAGQWFC